LAMTYPNHRPKRKVGVVRLGNAGWGWPLHGELELAGARADGGGEKHRFARDRVWGSYLKGNT